MDAHPILVPKGPAPFLGFVLPLASALQTTVSMEAAFLFHIHCGLLSTGIRKAK